MDLEFFSWEKPTPGTIKKKWYFFHIEDSGAKCYTLDLIYFQLSLKTISSEGFSP